MDTLRKATLIVQTLQQAGYIAYFAGGWVRDFLMKHPSDDIDIATNASPETIQELFPHTIPIGIAFGIIIVVYEGQPFEVATFRRDLEYIGGRRPEKIELATPEEDALRRDFTINGLFYDPLRDQIYDYVNGREDIEKGVIRAIGNADERFFEDRLRMIRAVRFASRFNFHIDEQTQMAIEKHAHTLFPAVAMERVWQEFQKMAKFPRFDRAILNMHNLGLLPVIFPSLDELSDQMIAQRVQNFIHFPPGTPAILYLMELFPNMPLEELQELSYYLKTSGQEGKILEFAHRGKQLLSQEESQIENDQWAQFYADRLFQTCFDAIAAQHPTEDKEELLGRHRQRRERLLPHIQRLVEKKPVVTAAILKDHGIVPGKLMGMLLKEAERIAIKEDLHDPESVILKLKQTPLWPKS